MQEKYDINDPTDVDIMRAKFDIISNNDWDQYIEMATEKDMGYKNINILTSSSKKAGISKYMSAKLLVWVLRLVDELDESMEEDQ